MAAEGVLQMPDLQYKMSKKITQLQKVIYHLNNKTDDHDFEVLDMAGQHESEIEQILRDAAEKIRTFKESLEIRKEESRVAEVVRELTAKFEQEKAEAAAKLEEFKQQATVQEDLLRGYLRTSEGRVESLTRNVATLKEKVQQQGLQLQEVTGTAEAASKENDELKRSHRREMEALKLRSQEEVADAHRVHRKQMDALAAEREAAESALRAEIAHATMAANRGLQELIADYESRMGKGRETYEAEIMRMREESRDETERNERREKEKEESWSQEREGLERANEEVRGRFAAAERRCDELVKRVEEAMTQLATTSKELETEKQRTSTLDAALSESRSVAAKLSQDLQAAVRKGDQLSSELRAERDAGERARARAQEEAAASASESEKLQRDLREELENRKKSDAAYEEEVGVRKRVEGELGAARKALEDVTNEARQLKIDLSTMREESAKKEAELAMSGTEASKRIAELKFTVADLQKELIAKVREAEERAAAALASQMNDLSARHARAVQDVEAKHTQETEAAAAAAAEWERALREQLEGELLKVEAKYNEEIGQASELLSQERAEARARAEALEEEIRRLRDGTGDLGVQNEGLTKRLADVTAAKEKAGRELQQRVEVLTQVSVKVKELEADLDSVRLAAERETAQLKREMEGARAVAEERLRRAKDEYETTLQRSEEDWKRATKDQVQQAVEASAREHALEVRQLRAQMQAEQEAEKQAVLQRQLSTAAGREQELLARLQGASAEADDIRRQHAAALASAEAEAEGAREALEARHKEELEVIGSRAQREIEALKASHADTLQNREAETLENARKDEAAHAAEMSALRREQKEEVSNLVSEWSARLSEAKADAERRQEEVANELRASHAAAVESLKAGHERALAEMRRAHDSLEKKHDEKENMIQQVGAANRQLQMELAGGKKEMQKLNADLVTTRSDFQRELRQTEAALTAAHRAEIERLMTENLAETRALQEGFEGAKAAMERGQEELQARLDAWKARFEAREPRPEDVARIGALEDLCAQKDEKYDKLYDATKKMRLELLNREENYNKVFGAAPVVQQGVADWLKPKTNMKDTSGSGGRSARSSNATGGPKSTASSRRPSGQENR
ncbi:hypothetical protein KFL_005800050 [Klebsormidium nitens]|uniref:Protein FAM184A/B N-terminal domain-containing protein n=1 Tax=Klebsormidium nitens TaxID=105231 RepID=A0A1Y1IMC4_KLENI|nr:hypothetical protein KFL_005800050 [Klebsormidium nitens]|eukprot:GAQ89946.1 hypothetical protein KFL_005800050 [Klebsormidium nitens]